jgi:hypothetical protein
MKLKPHLILIVVFLGLVVWTLDAVFDSLFGSAFPPFFTCC